MKKPKQVNGPFKGSIGQSGQDHTHWRTATTKLSRTLHSPTPKLLLQRQCGNIFNRSLILKPIPTERTATSAGWCSDYMMMVSYAKTNIITPTSEENYVCSVSSNRACKNVDSYKYLGVQQFTETSWTLRHKGEDILRRAKMYKNVVLLSRKFLPDKIKSLHNLVIGGTPQLSLSSQ